VDETVRTCSTHREESVVKALVGRPRHRRKNNKIIEVREVGWSGKD
jgi:hypothetical protein